MKNRDRFVGLRPQDVKVYPCRVRVENGHPSSRYRVSKVTAISCENRKLWTSSLAVSSDLAFTAEL